MTTRVVLALTDPLSALLVRGQLAYLRGRGFDVHLVTGLSSLAYRKGDPSGHDPMGEGLSTNLPEYSEPAAGLAASEGATHHTLPIVRDMAPAHDLRAVAAMTRLLARLRPTLVDGSTPKAGLVAMLAATATRVPVRVHTLRGLRLETTAGARRAALWTGHRVTCQLAHRVICVGPSLRARAIELGVVPAARAVVLGPGSGNGVDPEAFAPARHAAAGAALRAQLGVGDAPIVAFVGRLSRDKGVGELVAAWGRRRARGARLVIVGPDDPTDPIDAGARAAMHADATIHALGDRRDVGAVYAAADVVVLPSRREGLANVLLEAAAMARATIATRIPGCVDVVTDGETGALVAPGDVDALAAAIDRYLDDAALRARHGAAAQARVTRDFRMSDVWVRVADEYARLIATR